MSIGSLEQIEWLENPFGLCWVLLFLNGNFSRWWVGILSMLFQHLPRQVLMICMIPVCMNGRYELSVFIWLLLLFNVHDMLRFRALLQCLLSCWRPFIRFMECQNCIYRWSFTCLHFHVYVLKVIFRCRSYPLLGLLATAWSLCDSFSVKAPTPANFAIIWRNLLNCCLFDIY